MTEQETENAVTKMRQEVEKIGAEATEIKKLLKPLMDVKKIERQNLRFEKWSMRLKKCIYPLILLVAAVALVTVGIILICAAFSQANFKDNSWFIIIESVLLTVIVLVMLWSGTRLLQDE